jgi:ribosomal protein S8
MISHLKNCSRARLGTTSIPSTKLHLKCSLALLRHGFISRVDVAGANPPPPLLSPNKVSIDEVSELADGLASEPWAAYTSADSQSVISTTPAISTDDGRQVVLPPRNPADRRIWLDLKYFKNEPVIGFAKMVSRPTRRIEATLKDIEQIARGKRAGMIQGLSNPGDCIFFDTKELGVLEARECLEKKIGGRALFRIGAPR